jgi:hypothetical protein
MKKSCWMVWDEEVVAEMVWDEEEVAEMAWVKKGLLRWYGMKPRERKGRGGSFVFSSGTGL